MPSNDPPGARLRQWLTDPTPFTVEASDDAAKTSLELVCPFCTKVVCDVEPGDTLGVLWTMAQQHESDECEGSDL